jgi:hypothetical protein
MFFQLEQQNEKLRSQTQRATEQLKVLNTCADNVGEWRNSLVMSNSVAVKTEFYLNFFIFLYYFFLSILTPTLLLAWTNIQ